MEFDPVGRRDFLAGAGGLFLCTLAGEKVYLDREVDVDQLASNVEAPPKVVAADGAAPGAVQSAPQPDPQLAAADEAAASAPAQMERSDAALRTDSATAAAGGVREYWIAAEPVRWNPVPTGKDQMVNKKVKGRKKFTAFAYRAYSPGFTAPLGPATIPGPLISARVGEQVIVNFRNRLPIPATMHAHGFMYDEAMDGAYKGKFTEPGGFVQRNRTFRYFWEATPGTEGAWLYHDHGPMDPVPVFKGMFGPIVIRGESDPVPDKEFFLAFHSFTPMATGHGSFSCVNGRAYAGNTPTLQTKVGDSVRIHVLAIDNDFHTFHLHGHRWADPNGGKVIDNQTLGPGDSITAEFIEDNPGRWFYHCHVFSHLHMGMNGWYLVDP